MPRSLVRALPVFALAALAPSIVLADQPQPWQTGLQPAASPIMEMIHRFNDGLLIVISLIVLLVLGLLLYVMIRFNARANPTPSDVSHNTVVEVVWTVVPILILVGIAVPSFSLLFAQHDPVRAIADFDPENDRQVTIKATGFQWAWSYEYMDEDDVSFDAFILGDPDNDYALTEADLAEHPGAGPRLLAVDNEIVVPVGVVVRLQTTSTDVIHGFAVPALGLKLDAVPGRLNETWFRADREGVYYGQCSELCGQLHAFMPIAVRAVSEELYDTWVEAAAEDLDAANDMLAAALERQDTATRTALAR